MEAAKKNITEIFNRASKLQVPYFQRSYVWKKDQWERFLEDMAFATHSNRHYFMGAVILKQQETQIGETATFTIIDGQQRLTTFTLFFKALYEVNGQPELFPTFFTTVQNELIMEHNHFDRPVFEAILAGRLDDITDEEKTGNIYQCYDYFKKNIKPKEIDPNRLFSNIMFVGITLQRDEDEQQIFDTINSLGVRLTTAELLKNYLFNRNFTTYEQFWRNTFEADQATRDYWDTEVTAGRIQRTNIDLFLQAYLSIRIQDPDLNVPSEAKERFYKVESIFASYKEFIEEYFKDKELLIAELQEYAKLYRSIINPLATKQFLAQNDRIGRLNIIIFGLEMTTIIPYVLYVAKHVADEAERERMLRYLETYIMRRVITRSTTKNYNNIFRSLILNQVTSFDQLEMYFISRSEATNRLPSNTRVAEAFVDEALTNKQAKTVLFLIESAIHSNRHNTRLLDYDDYSLEHVMPKQWRNNWSKEGLTAEQIEERDDMLLTLGNLTLLTSSLNSAIRDANWERKVSGTATNPGLKHFAQGLDTFSHYIERPQWDESVIQERAQELIKHAITIWDIPADTEEKIAQLRETKTNEVEYDLDHYTHLTSSSITSELFNQLRPKIMELHPSVTETFRRHYIAYKADVNFVDITPMASSLLLSLNSKHQGFNDPRGLCRDVQNIGRRGNGDYEMKLTTSADIPYALDLIKQALQKQVEVSE